VFNGFSLPSLVEVTCRDRVFTEAARVSGTGLTPAVRLVGFLRRSPVVFWVVQPVLHGPENLRVVTRSCLQVAVPGLPAVMVVHARDRDDAAQT
jgi:hypothetical protein